MNRPGYGCLTCPKDECDGCTTILATREEMAMLRCGVSKARKKKYPERRQPLGAMRKTLRAYCSTEWEVWL